MDISVVYPDGSKSVLVVHPRDTLAKIKGKLQTQNSIKIDNILFVGKDQSIYINTKRKISNSRCAYGEFKSIIRRQYYYNAFKTLVEEKKGTLISDLSVYINAHSHLSIKCQNDHVFKITLNNLKHDKWCSKCRLNIGELISKCAIEHLLDKQFVKIRPSWLKINTQPLELDIYNEELSIAIEYNGIQHYKYVKHFHRTADALEKQQERDRIKKELCEQNDIFLIIIPYTIESTDICKYIADILVCHNYNLVNPEQSFDESNIYRFMSNKDRLTEYIELKGGNLISGEYITRESHVKIQCDEGHVWETKIKCLYKGGWCHECGYKVEEETKRKIAETMKKFNSTEEGKLLKQISHEKRSITMEKKREQIRANLMEKQCRKCNKIKEINQFHLKNDTTDGRQPYCKECINEIKREKRKKDKEDD